MSDRGNDSAAPGGEGLRPLLDENRQFAPAEEFRRQARVNDEKVYAASVKLPKRSKSFSERPPNLNLRMVKQVPRRHPGGRIACTRDPSGSLASILW